MYVRNENVSHIFNGELKSEKRVSTTNLYFLEEKYSLQSSGAGVHVGVGVREGTENN